MFEPRFEEVILVKKYFSQNFCFSRTRNSLEKLSYEFSHQNLIFPTRLKKYLGPTVWISMVFATLKSKRALKDKWAELRTAEK